jgi:hypothetical protein
MPTAASAASAAAARALGYHGLGDLIEAQQLSPSHIAILFDASASKTAARDCALIILAGAVARYRSAPKLWDGGTIERDLAMNALADTPDPAAAVAMLAAKAGKLVAAR